MAVNFLCVIQASETPYYGSNQENYLRAGSAGSLFSGGPLADIRVCILPFLCALLQAEDVGWWLKAREALVTEVFYFLC